MLVLIVEDEARIASFLRKGLTAEGYACIVATNVADAVSLATTEPVELVLLDIILPGGSGMDVLRALRQSRPRLPILMLTAMDDLPSKLAGLNEGADDYLTKPFNFDELLARIRAIARRGQAHAVELRAGDLVLDLSTRRATSGQSRVELTVRESALLECFIRHPSQVLSRVQLLSNVWAYESEAESNVVDVYVRYLRRKVPWPPDVAIETVRGAGYRLAVP